MCDSLIFFNSTSSNGANIARLFYRAANDGFSRGFWYVPFRKLFVCMQWISNNYNFETRIDSFSFLRGLRNRIIQKLPRVHKVICGKVCLRVFVDKLVISNFSNMHLFLSKVFTLIEIFISNFFKFINCNINDLSLIFEQFLWHILLIVFNYA